MALAEVLDLPPYTVQAIAHLAHTERATITLKGWTVRRLGVLVLHQEDEEGNPLPLQAESVAQPQQPSSLPEADTVTPEHGQSEGTPAPKPTTSAHHPAG